MNKILLLLSFICLCNVGVAQLNKGYNEPKPIVSINNDWTFPSIEGYDGTYQFIVVEKKNFLISTETLELINTSRKVSEDTTLDLSPYLKVFIPSKNAIEATTFAPFQSAHTFKN